LGLKAGARGRARRGGQANSLTRLARSLLFSRLKDIQHGRLHLAEAGHQHRFGRERPSESLEATIRVRDPRFYSDAVFGGSTGAGESYMRGYWDCDDLTSLIRIMLVNRDTLSKIDSGLPRLSAPLLKVAHWFNRNTAAGSRRNIAAHYDLGNKFFELFLDESMAYSCGIFESADASLLQASTAKFEAVCTKLKLGPGQRLLEIGTGWGGLAMHAARHYGCHVTTTTISREQYEFSRERIARAGLSDRVTLLLEDYRDLRGSFDALASVEMIEAVGHQYLDTYFSRCSSLLQPSGAMLLQAITIRDQSYERARRTVDFIKRFIFPGSFIPSMKVLGDSIARATDLKVSHVEDIGPHYARTLRLWREGLLSRREEIRAQGYPESFVRMWEYYLCYCEGGFEERQLGDVQMLLTKPRSRRAAIAPIHASPA
jgi:cyclopropane-fatty-acyl-phospholipid synthase